MERARVQAELKAKTARPPLPPLVWNTWAEPSGLKSYKPATVLDPGSDYRVSVHLSALAYAAAGVSSQAGGARLQEQIENWLRAEVQTASLKIVMLHDPARFEAPGVPVRELEVDLNRVRNLAADALAVADPLRALAADPRAPFLFGDAEFTITTRNLEGPASLSFSVWANNRPVQEFSATFCIARDRASADARCPGTGAFVYTFRGVDSLRLATQETPTPDAALHFVEMATDDGPRIHGVFWQRDAPGREFTTWRLDRRDTPQALQRLLADTILPAFFKVSEEELRAAGRALYNTMFPDGAARGVFEDFVRARRASTAATPATAVPSIFVRMVLSDAELMLPLGLMAVADDFVGFGFRVEQPLPVQTYERGASCVTQWVMAIPAEPAGDQELTDAVAALGQRIDAGAGWPARGAVLHRNIVPFRQWLADRGARAEPVAVFVTSHHRRDTIFFHEGEAILSRNVERPFVHPSMVVLNGCGTGAPGAADFISQLSQRGVTTVIATSTEVKGEMAGHFLACLTDALERADPAAGATVSDAYVAALRCLRDKKGEVGPQYGARALAYLLLGNANIRLCPPRRTP